MRSNESGRSMIEMLGVLAIIGVLSVGGIAGYSRAMTKYRTNKTIDQVTMLVTNIRTLYAQQNNFEELYNASAYDLGVIPDDLVPAGFTNTNDNTSTLKNAFKGNVFINSAPATSDDATNHLPTAFEIAFNGLSREACVAMATSDWGSGSSSGLIGITFSGDASGAGIGSASSLESGKEMYVGCTGGDASTATVGKIIACPTGSTATGSYRIPLSVANASKACNCTGASSNKCSIVWRYF